ncbi:MAG: DsbA family protein [Candidatus Buchananbacteria bacterium]
MWNIFKKANSGLSTATPQVSFFMGLLGGIAVISTVGFIILLVLFVGGKNTGTTTKPVVKANVNAAVNQPAAVTGPVEIKITSADNIIGNPDAKVTMVVFSDFQCPYCGRFHPAVKQALTTYGNKIRVVFKNFPLDSIHPNARPAANAAECVANISGTEVYWQYVDKLFANQTALSDTLYASLAKQLGVATDKFSECYAAKKYGDKVEADQQQGLAAGIQGTPAVVINGQVIAGAVPFEQIKTAIDAALK